jgi:ABC-2 type transport system permease protein
MNMQELWCKLSNIRHFGLKELRSLFRDPAMVVLIIYAFTLAIYEGATAIPEAPHRASIAVVDEDRSQASLRIINAFQLPYFISPKVISLQEMDRGMDSGLYTFTLNIPPRFQQDLLAGRQPTVQLNVDATQVEQAFTGAGYIHQIIASESAAFLKRYRSNEVLPVEVVMRTAFNPNLSRAWFGAVNEVINQVTLLAIILTGAALIREREHGTIEHLLVMPVTPFEIMVGKVWAMGLVVLVAATFALRFVVELWLDVPIQGSLWLFAGGSALHLFAATSMGIFFGTVARSMPQLGLLVILTLIPLQVLSGGMSPRESMPELVQNIMLVAPTTHYVELAQAILFRNAGVAVVWPHLLALTVIGTVFFVGALSRLRSSLN